MNRDYVDAEGNLVKYVKPPKVQKAKGSIEIMVPEENAAPGSVMRAVTEFRDDNGYHAFLQFAVVSEPYAPYTTFRVSCSDPKLLTLIKLRFGDGVL